MIEVSHVSKIYESAAGPVTVLRDLDLKVGVAETVAIVGPSGSGKTTLLNLLGALDQPSTGTVTIGGAVAIDGPTLFLQGALLLLGGVSLLLIGERTVEKGGAFVSQAAITVGSQKDMRQAGSQPGATDVYPLTVFALGGMLMFVSAVVFMLFLLLIVYMTMG